MDAVPGLHDDRGFRQRAAREPFANLLNGDVIDVGPERPNDANLPGEVILTLRAQAWTDTEEQVGPLRGGLLKQLRERDVESGCDGLAITGVFVVDTTPFPALVRPGLDGPEQNQVLLVKQRGQEPDGD